MIKVGTKVVFKNGPIFNEDGTVHIRDPHGSHPEYYPKKGTVGEVMSLMKDDKWGIIKWEKGSTSNDDLWCCSIKNVEELKEEKTMKFSIGDKVEFLGNKNPSNSSYVPKAGTIGTVVAIEDKDDKEYDTKVKWPKGSTAASFDDTWWTNSEYLKLVSEGEDRPYVDDSLKDLYERVDRYETIIESLKSDIEDYKKDLEEVKAEIIRKEKENHDKEVTKPSEEFPTLTPKEKEVFDITLLGYLVDRYLNSDDDDEEISVAGYEKFLDKIIEKKGKKSDLEDLIRKATK